MGVDISTWRVRIAGYSHRGGFSQIEKVQGYNGDTHWSAGTDMTYRLVITMSALLVVLTGVLAVISVNGAFVTLVVSDIGVDNCVAFDTRKYVCDIDPTRPAIRSAAATRCTDSTHATRHHPHVIRQLLIIGGVESNPGPPKVDPMEAMKKEVIAEIRQVRTDITGISKDVRDLKHDMRGIKTKCSELETTCREIREHFSGLSQRVSTIEEDIGEIKEKEHINNLDFEELGRRLDELEQRMDDAPLGDSDKLARLEEEIDRLEEFSRKDNLIMYDIPEVPDEKYEMCRSAVLQILQKTITSRTWKERDIVRAHRLGKYNPNSERPRPMIVKFFHWRDNKIVLHDKQSIIDEGHGVSNDLTWRKRQKLRELNAEGKSGYYRGGQLVIVDNTRASIRTRGGTRGPGRGRGGGRGAANQFPLRRTRSQSPTNVSRDAGY